MKIFSSISSFSASIYTLYSSSIPTNYPFVGSIHQPPILFFTLPPHRCLSPSHGPLPARAQRRRRPAGRRRATPPSVGARLHPPPPRLAHLSSLPLPCRRGFDGAGSSSGGACGGRPRGRRPARRRLGARPRGEQAAADERTAAALARGGLQRRRRSSFVVPPAEVVPGPWKVIRSLVPTRRRLRLDPSAKLYFPCTHPELCSLLIHKFLFDCSAEASIPASVRCIKNRIFNSSKTGFLLTDFFCTTVHIETE